MCLSVGEYEPVSVGALRGQRHQLPWNLQGFRELNLALLEGQPVLVTTESSFQTGSSSLKLVVVWLHLWATVRATIYEHLDLVFYTIS